MCCVSRCFHPTGGTLPPCLIRVRGVAAMIPTLFLGFMAAIAALFGFTEAAAAQGKRVALVIGNATYQHAPKLANPLNDAAAIDRMLKSIGFDSVTTRQDLTSQDFKRALRDFFDAAQNADIAVVYYAGHGIQVGDMNYMIPVDARLATEIDVQDEAVSLDRILLALQPARRLRLVILDACRENPFLGGMKLTQATRRITRGLARVEPENNSLVAYAAKKGQIAQDGAGEHSPFTAALLKHLPGPGLDIRLALGRVRDDVLKSTANKQEPFVYGSLGGDSIPLAPGPAASADAATAVKNDYALAERIGTQKAWEAFLTNHKEGIYAGLAREPLAKLAPAEGRPAAAPPAGSAEASVLAPASAADVAKPGAASNNAPRPDAPRVAKAGDETAACSRDKQKLDLLRPNIGQGWAREDLKRLERATPCERVRAEAASLLLGSSDVSPRVGAPDAPPRTGTFQLQSQPQQPDQGLGTVLSSIAELRRLGCTAGQSDAAMNETLAKTVRSYLAEKGRSDADIKVVEALLADLKAENKRLCPTAAQAQ
jgi:Caspase domain